MVPETYALGALWLAKCKVHPPLESDTGILEMTDIIGQIVIAKSGCGESRASMIWSQHLFHFLCEFVS